MDRSLEYSILRQVALYPSKDDVIEETGGRQLFVVKVVSWNETASPVSADAVLSHIPKLG
jgi:hypothetical protein